MLNKYLDAMERLQPNNNNKVKAPPPAIKSKIGLEN